MEQLDSVHLLSRTDEFNGLSGNVFYRERCTASCVTVHLGKNYTGDVEKVVEGFCNVYRILTEHSVNGKKYLGGFYGLFYFNELSHKLLVNVKTSGSIYDDHVVTVLLGVLNARFCNFNRGDLRSHREYGDINRFADDLQLVNRRRSVNVTGNEQRIFALLLIHSRNLTCVSGFTRTLKTYHHNDCGRLGADVDLGSLTAHKLDELLVYYLDYLLSRNQGFKHLCTYCSLGY